LNFFYLNAALPFFLNSKAISLFDVIVKILYLRLIMVKSKRYNLNEIPENEGSRRNLCETMNFIG